MLVTELNPLGERITGFSHPEALGRHCREVFHCVLCGQKCPLESPSIPEKLLDQEDYITNRDGQQIPILYSTLAFRDELRFLVKDQGPGIPPAELPHLSKFFQQGQDAGRGGGFGMGLAKVKRIIDAHGGRIWVETAPGKGAAFFFTFPVGSPDLPVC